MPLINQQQVLHSRPAGKATVDNFRLVEVPVPDLADGQVLVRHHFLSLDPYMRIRVNDAKNDAAPQPLGQPMVGGTVGDVVASRHARYGVGDKVVGMGGWQLCSTVDGDAPGSLRKVDATQVPLSAYLGAVGMPGVTAWYGLAQIVAPKAGETGEFWPPGAPGARRRRGRGQPEVPRVRGRRPGRAPEAFLGLLRGKNFGKPLVKLL